ncbi:MAG: class I mannose-6-phosphate isomerase [Clostridia bacterium]|nr:class I mannose-6-phosphate isomerase [Clostridia bacterium]
MSVIPGLNSTNAQGDALSSLIGKYGQALVGDRIQGEFPLLLKLIDARDQLSVQVHPNDDYARIYENKLGKTEAWAILRAEPGAKLVYGIKEGTTADMLQEACGKGREIEKLLRYVPVHEGDVFYIPSGTVHAIGAGIMLYEIQQSSDVTYRFYDWDRTDAQGNKRELHIKQALDVTRIDYQPAAVVPKLIPDDTCVREELLNTSYFYLERLTDCHDTPFDASTHYFSVMTLLTEGVITINGQRSVYPAGQTIFIPASTVRFTLTCGKCLISSPAHN